MYGQVQYKGNTDRTVSSTSTTVVGVALAHFVENGGWVSVMAL